MEINQDDYIDVLIVGCGISGLTSAYKIKEKEKYLNIVMVEGNTKLGGQLNSTEYGELGPKYIYKNHYHIYDLLKKLEIKVNYTHKIQCSISNIIENVLKKESWIKSKLIIFEINLILNRIDVLSSKYDPGRFKISKNDATVEIFIKNNLIFEKSRNILRIFARLICGTTSNIIKLTEFLSICNSAGGFQNLLDIHIKSQLLTENLIEFSTQELIEKFETILEDVRILKNVIITDIFHYPDYVHVRDTNGKIYNTSVLILATPWNSLENVNIFPSIPKELPPFTFNIKCYMTSFILDYPNNQPWKIFNFCGSFMSLEKPILIAYEYKSTKLAGVILHDHVEFEHISDYSILEKLSEKFGEGMFLPNVIIKKTFEQNLLLGLPPTTPWNRIIFSSTTAATSFRGCLSGAVQSGYRAAINALLTIRPQNVTWKDLEQIQKARPLKKGISWWKYIISEINLFDCSVISLSICAIFIHIAIKLLKF